MRRSLFTILFFLFAPLLFAQSIRCAACGKIIRSDYITSEGKAYCARTCFEKTLPKCAGCGKIIRGEGFQFKKKMYCSINCMKQVLPKCDSCGQPIAGTYSVFESPEGEKRTLCNHCSLLSRCFACELPGRTSRLPDGRYICVKCSRDAIRTREDARKLFDEVREVTEKLLGRKIDCRLRFHTVGYPELLKISGIQMEDTAIELGLCRCNMLERKTGGVSEIVKFDCDVYMLDTLPRWRFIEIAAHELAHHWQFHQYPYLKQEPKKIPEGFAEYVSSLVNTEYGQAHLNKRKLERRDFIYGSGYKLFLGIAEKGGLDSVFRYLKQQDRR